MRNQTISWRYVSIIIGVLLLLAIYKITSDLFMNNVKNKSNNELYIYIKSNESIDRLIYNLQKENVLINVASFERVAKIINLASMLKTGRYKITEGMNNIALIKLLKSGRQEPLNLVIKYARKKENLALALSKQLEIDSSEIIALLNDSLTLKTTKMDSNNIINLFIPNTYNVYWNISGKKLIYRMLKEYNIFWNSNRTTKSILLNMSPKEISILASIVMSETNKPDEMPIIARTYLNRLNIGMPLQADPTILFALNDTSIKRVLSIHTALQSPFNTYLNLGLPPGAICLATPTAIDAVLNAPLHNYIYFCAKEDFSGYHNFSETFEQHQLNAKRYQHALNKLGL
jgi:UPF0755 protein